MKRFFQFIGIVVTILILAGIFIGVGGVLSFFGPGEDRISKASILALDLEGVIIDAKDILEMLRKYRKDDKIKGVLIRIASPGGVVGPSQELHDEIERTRDEFKKPIIAYCASVAASGAFYAAVAADKIYTTPGCMVGSIGALIEFVDLEKLYDWAKIKRYAVTTGKYKDAGAEYKSLSADERALFQNLLNDVLRQFKEAIVDGRHLKKEFVDQYADGRVFTGAQAVELGFADELGTWEDARRALGEMTKLGDDPEIFKPKKARSIMEIFEEASSSAGDSKFGKTVEQLMQTRLKGQPLFLLPGAVKL